MSSILEQRLGITTFTFIISNNSDQNLQQNFPLLRNVWALASTLSLSCQSSSGTRSYSGLQLHFFIPLSSLFDRGFLSFDSLPLLVHFSTFQNPLHDLACIDILKSMIANLLVNMKGLSSGVRIVSQWHEGCRAMVDGIRSTKREVGKICCCRSKRSRKDDGINVLVS